MLTWTSKSQFIALLVFGQQWLSLLSVMTALLNSALAIVHTWNIESGWWIRSFRFAYKNVHSIGGNVSTKYTFGQSFITTVGSYSAVQCFPQGNIQTGCLWIINYLSFPAEKTLLATHVSKHFLLGNPYWPKAFQVLLTFCSHAT